MSARPFVVLKFGGTSVSTLPNWANIQGELRKRLDEGLFPVVVCSALTGVTNLLEEVVASAVTGDVEVPIGKIEEKHRALSRAMGLEDDLLAPRMAELRRLALGAQLTGEVSPRLHARIASQGELWSTALGAAWLKAQGLDAGWLDVRDVLTSAPDPHGGPWKNTLSAACPYDPDPDAQVALRALGFEVLVTQGFIAKDPEGHTVLLGRGGSDTTGAYLAARLQAVRCEIWTDVPGLYTANPRLVPNARLLRQVDYDEAQEIASTGAKVLHPRCLPPVRLWNIPMEVRCTPHPDVEGTWIGPTAGDQAARVKAISAKTGITLISMDTSGMWQQVGFLAEAFGVFKDHGLSIDLVSTSEMNVTVTLDPSSNSLDGTVLAALTADLSRFCQAKVVGPCAAVSLVGRNIRGLLHKLGPALRIFEEKRIHLVSQAASDLNLTFVVDQNEAERLVHQLHALLFPDHADEDWFGPTWAERFGSPLPPAPSRQPWWADRREALLAAAAQGTPCYVYDGATVDARIADVRSLGSNRVFYAMKANWNAGILERVKAAGLGFECVSRGELDHVFGLFPALDPDRVLFTPNFAGRDEYAYAFERGVTVTLDNIHPVEAWPELFAGKQVLLRIDPGQGRGHHQHVHTAGRESKFGVWPDQLDHLKALALAAGCTVVGLHAHVGSGIREASSWREVGLFLAQVADQFPEAYILNLGGGLGVVEKPEQHPLDLATLRESIQSFRAAFPRFELWLEPGRFLVAEAGVLLCGVTQTKEKGDVRYVGVDAGMNSLIRPALYGAWHQIANLTRHGADPTERYHVVGPICESGDTLGRDRHLPPTVEGDVLLIATAGAYGRSMASEYNLRRPAVERWV